MTVKQIAELFREKEYMLNMGAGKLSRWLNCSREDVYEAKDLARKNENKFPKILIFDIETSPSITYTFGRFKVNINLEQVEQDPIMLTWSAKWLYSSDIMSDAITPKEVKEFNDKRIVESLWKLLDEADIVVAHFGDAFDIPMLNSRAILNGLSPYTSVNSIDTKKVASKQFRFPSNKLDALATYFGVGNKIKTDFDLWKRCLHGELAAIKEMEVYNIQDVVVLEEVYLKLRPWIKSHPNIGLYLDSDVPVCSACGSKDIKPTNTYYFTQTGKYPEYRCKCGALTRGRKTVQDKDKRKQLLIGLAR